MDLSPALPSIVVDLFAGPGGWDEGVRPLGIRPHGIEWDEHAIATAQAAGHLRETLPPDAKGRVKGPDIATIDPRMFAAKLGAIVRGLIASPPCQGFSMAGKGKGRADALLLLAALEDVRTLADLEAAIVTLHELMTDDRSLLVLEPLRWALALTPSWLAWEQVPGVLPIWEACAVVLRAIGYSVEAGLLHAEQYGVPQTRTRAILVARAPWFTATHGPAKLPTPTHSRYYSRKPKRLDAGVAPWISMADAITWGLDDRPSPTITGGGTDTGGAEPIAHLSSRYVGTPGWVPRLANEGNPPESAAWVHTRPSPTIVGSFCPDVVAAPGYRKPGDGPRQKAVGSVRVTVQEAAVLQSFPADYPWHGLKGARFRQVGDAVPPLLAQAVARTRRGCSGRHLRPVGRSRAGGLMTHRLRYRRSAATTTAVTVVPSAFALTTAASHTSSGIRSERGIVAISDRPSDGHGLVLASGHEVPRGDLLGEHVGHRVVASGAECGDLRAKRLGLSGESGADLGGLRGGDRAGGLGVHGVSPRRCVYSTYLQVYLRRKSREGEV